MIWLNHFKQMVKGKNMKITSILQTPQSKNHINVGVLAVRLGIGFAFLWAGINKVADPAAFGMMLQNMAGIDPMMAPNMALMIGISEIIAGILVSMGFITRLAVAFQIIILIGAQMMFGFDFTAGPAIWKDPTLIGVAIMLFLYGSGKFSLDYRISKSKDKQLAEYQ
jgi:uncharacterized membrane protein YphA (DoxX/SURF4 family)